MEHDPCADRPAPNTDRNEFQNKTGQQNRMPRKPTNQRAAAGRQIAGVGAASRQCRRAQSSLPSYLDEALSVRDRESVARHLQVCAACRYELRLLAHTDRALTAAASAVPLPGDLRAGFYARLADTPRPLPRWRASVPAFAACGLLLLACGTAYRLHGARGNHADVPADYSSSLAFDAPVSRAFAPMSRAFAPASREVHSAEALFDRPPGPSAKLIVAAHRHALSAHYLLADAANQRAKSRWTRPGRMQVAMLTREDGGTNARTGRQGFSFAPSAPGPVVRRPGLQTEGASKAAFALSRPEEQSNSSALGLEAERAPGQDPRWAKESALAVGDDTQAAVGGNDTDGVSFQVRDARRGFTAGTRSESRLIRRNGQRVLSVHMEDQTERGSEDKTEAGGDDRNTTEPGAADKSGLEQPRTDAPPDAKTTRDTNAGTEKPR